ncbi:PDZ domain-containing protein 11-like [Oscarella lobularis]|uniref:PDZ domain-containing protein 11-like n=1 Tax=Oscarella lobularis TaxID=121494 RepID=UPI00331391F8
MALEPFDDQDMITVYLPPYEPPPAWIPAEEREGDPDYGNDLEAFLPRDIHLKRPGPSDQLGFHVRGGSERRSDIYISKIVPNSEAEKIGLKVGDQILHVNGASFGDIDHAQAVKILKSTSDIMMTVRYYPYGYRKTFTVNRCLTRRVSEPAMTK